MIFLLSAGNATRLGDAAPHGCKAAAVLGDRTMIDWTWENIGRPTVICRSDHLNAFSSVIDHVTCDDGGGPARAVARGLAKAFGPGPLYGSVTIVYADTWVPDWGVPNDAEFCGVAAAAGGRAWDVVEGGHVTYREVPEGEAALVCVGLYRFASARQLACAVDVALANAKPETEVGMGDVVNAYGLPFVPVQGWQDVGDPLARARWRPL